MAAVCHRVRTGLAVFLEAQSPDGTYAPNPADPMVTSLRSLFSRRVMRGPEQPDEITDRG
jgi:hypothetical protein